MPTPDLDTVNAIRDAMKKIRTWDIILVMTVAQLILFWIILKLLGINIVIV